jgi:hypothetical protein
MAATRDSPNEWQSSFRTAKLENVCEVASQLLKFKRVHKPQTIPKCPKLRNLRSGNFHCYQNLLTPRQHVFSLISSLRDVITSFSVLVSVLAECSSLAWGVETRVCIECLAPLSRCALLQVACTGTAAVFLSDYLRDQPRVRRVYFLVSIRPSPIGTCIAHPRTQPTRG